MNTDRIYKKTLVSDNSFIAVLKEEDIREYMFH